MERSASTSFSSLNDAQQAILVEMLEAEEQGHAPDVQQWLARYPEQAELIRQFLADRTALEALLTRQAHAAELPAHVRYFGDYELLDVIARGGMGVIYRARQTSLNRIVALKMILGGQFSSSTEVDRFRSEAQAAGQLDHAHIVPLYEVGEYQGQHYFTMKYVATGSLADLLAKNEKLPLKNHEAATLIGTVARAVHYAHQHGILHRDLKPANILLQREGEALVPLVVDFGLAKKLDPQEHLTQTGAIVGTPCYMAPEQARAEKQLSTAIDVYSLGAILYELLTGQPPFKGTSVAATLEQLQHREPSRPRQLQPALSADLETICLKCLAKEPGQRYGTAEALAEDLDRWLSGSPIQARPVGIVERSIKWARRRPAVATLAAMLLVTLLAGLAGMWVMLQKSRRAEQHASNAADAERRERERAQTAEQQAAEQRDHAEQSLYYHRVSAAYRYWRENNLSKMQALLESCQAKHRSWEWGYLQALLTPEEKRIAGMSFQMTTDQKRMLIQQNDGQYALWDVSQWKELKKLNVPQHWRCVLSPDGSRYAAVNQLQLQVRSTADDALVFKLEPAPIQALDINTLCFNPDNSQICLAGTQANCAQGGYAASTVLVIDGNSGTTQYVLKSSGIHAAFSPDGKMLAAYTEQMGVFNTEGSSAANEQEIHGLYHWPTGKPLRIGQMLNREASWVELVEARTGKSLGKLCDPEMPEIGQSFAWSPDGQRLCTTERGTTTIYDAVSRKQIAKLAGHQDVATAIAFGPYPNQLYTGGLDTTIKQWNLAEKKATQDYRGHAQWITSLAVIDKGRRMLSASADRTIRCWNLTGQPGVQDWPTSGDTSSGLSLDSNNFHWATGYSRDGKQVLALEQSTVGTLIQMAFTKDTTGAFTLCLLDSQSQKTIRKFPTVWRSRSMIHQGMQLLFTRDGKLGAGCLNQQPVILDLETGKEHFLPYGSGSILSISPDDTRLITVQAQDTDETAPLPLPPVAGVMKYSQSKELQAVEATSVGMPASELRKPLPVVNDPGSDVRVDTLIMMPSIIKVWDLKNRNELASLTIPDMLIIGTSWSADGRWLAAIGWGPYTRVENTLQRRAEIRLMDVRTMQVKKVLAGLGTMAPRKPSFSPDGRLLTAACWDGNVYVWNVATGELHHTLRGHQGYVWSACFSDDGKRLFSSGNDGTIKVWDPVTGEEIITLMNVGGKFALRQDDAGTLVGQGDYFFRRWLTK